jgi:hypothetical protein
MTGTWRFLRTILSEAEYHGYGKGQKPNPRKLRAPSDAKEDIFKYVVQRYGEHEADELRSAMKSMKFGDFRKHVMMQFSDPQLDGKIEDLAKSAIQAYRARQGGGQPEPQAGQTAGRSGKIYTDPEAEDERSAKIDAMRQARAQPAGGQSAAKALMTPKKATGEKPTHAVGSAGQHQPKAQPSIDAGVQPQYSADELKRMRIAKSGLVRAQREVDKETRIKGPAAGDKLAKSLGVPSTAERTSVHPDTGQKTVQIWSPDRVLRHMDPDRNPDRQAGGGEKLDRTELIKRGMLRRSAAPKPGQLGPNRPGSFHGERWKPHGREEEVPAGIPNQATGNWMHFRRQVDPKHTGREVIWNAHVGEQFLGTRGEWQLPSVFASSEAERGAKMRAGQAPPEGEFGEEEPTQQDAPAFDDEDDEG